MGWISRLIWLRLVPLLDEVGLEIDKEVWSGGLSLSLPGGTGSRRTGQLAFADKLTNFLLRRKSLIGGNLDGRTLIWMSQNSQNFFYYYYVYSYSSSLTNPTSQKQFNIVRLFVHVKLN